MKKKLRELRKKRDFIRYVKGALRIRREIFIGYSEKRINSYEIKIKGYYKKKSIKDCFVADIETRKSYICIKVKSKAKKRGGKNKNINYTR